MKVPSFALLLLAALVALSHGQESALTSEEKSLRGGVPEEQGRRRTFDLVSLLFTIIAPRK